MAIDFAGIALSRIGIVFARGWVFDSYVISLYIENRSPDCAQMGAK